MARFIVHTPNKEFNERVIGVQFSRGQATVDEYSIDKSLGYTVEEIARRMQNDYGYEVEEIFAEEAKPQSIKEKYKDAVK